MEFELMYPQIIVYSLIISFVMILFWRKKKKYKKGVLVANSSYLKKTKYYKSLLIRYRIYNVLIRVLCIVLIFFTAILSARIFHEDKFEEKHDNRDIILCMDVSGSVYGLNSSIAKSLNEIVGSLKDERFGITIFDNSSVQLVPLTNDYLYAQSILEQVSEAFDSKNFTSYSGGLALTSSNSQLRKLITEGTRMGVGSSLIGDGLASCALSFKNDKDRTKIIILTTDNEVYGNQIMTVAESANYCKENNIKIYSVGTVDISNSNKQGLVNASKVSNGEYYDYKNLSTNEIVNKINTLNKSSIVTKSYTLSKDFPEIVFSILLYITAALFILDWRVRI